MRDYKFVAGQNDSCDDKPADERCCSRCRKRLFEQTGKQACWAHDCREAEHHCGKREFDYAPRATLVIVSGDLTAAHSPSLDSIEPRGKGKTHLERQLWRCGHMAFGSQQHAFSIEPARIASKRTVAPDHPMAR